MIRQVMADQQLKLEEVNDPAILDRGREQSERAKRNGDWLQANWAVLLPRARGRFVAVAGQEAFIADTASEAWNMALAAHPEDDGAISQYVFPEGGVRIYVYRS
jgi:hypothetical protein